jgi:hypothetical protein
VFTAVKPAIRDAFDRYLLRTQSQEQMDLLRALDAETLLEELNDPGKPSSPSSDVSG